MAERIAIGVDLGGTKVEVVVARGVQAEPRAHGAVEAPLAELARRRFPTERERGYEAVLERTVHAIREVARDAGVDLAGVAIGVGMPGGVTRRGGLIKNSNTVCLNGRPFRADLCRALGRVEATVPGPQAIVFDNDANCFALAEARMGAAATFERGVVFGVILGTGVGGGLVIGNEVWRGTQGIGGEWGHHAVWAGAPDARGCYCGQRGCVEQYLSGPAVEADYEARSAIQRPLAEIVARRAGDQHAAAAIETLLASFGRALANVIDILDPSVVVLGGGVSNVDLLYDEGRDRVAACVFNDELTTPIVRHALGDSAGVLGAALIAT